MSDNSTEIDVEPTEPPETITAEELREMLAEEVTVTLDTTIFGFVTLAASLSTAAHEALLEGDLEKVDAALTLLSAVEEQNADIDTAYQEPASYVRDDRVTGMYDEPIPVTHEDDN